MNTLLFTLIAALTLGTHSTVQHIGDTPTNSTPRIDEFAEITKYVPVDIYSDRIVGNINAAVSIITWLDYECPFCAQFHPVLETYFTNNSESVRIVYRHYPLDFHPSARIFAQAAECIAEQGGTPVFEEFSRIVFAEGAIEQNIPTYVKKAGAKPEYVTKCIASGRADRIIEKHMNDANASGFVGTPHTIVVNERTKRAIVLQGAVDVETLESAVRFVQ